MRVKEEHSRSTRCFLDMYDGGQILQFSATNVDAQARILTRDPREQLMVRMERYGSEELSPAIHTTRSFIERNRIAKFILKVIGVIAASLVFCGMRW